MTETATEVSVVAVVSEKDAGSGLFRSGWRVDLVIEAVEVSLERPRGDRTSEGCALGDAGLQDYFGQISGGRATDDCAEMIEW